MALCYFDEAEEEGVKSQVAPRRPLKVVAGKRRDVPDDFARLVAVIAKWLRIDDPDYIMVLVSAVLAHRLGGDPVWLLIVGPPSGAKSELLRALYGYRRIYPLSSLTPRTFASGFKSKDCDPSLLARLKDETLILKDFTTILQMRREDRQAILAQLREIYDGRFDQAFGTGHELHWEGRLGFIAGVTEVIDRHHAVLAVLGERFVLFRLQVGDRMAQAEAALENSGRETEMRQELCAAMHEFLEARTTLSVTIGEEANATLVRLAEFVTRARTGVLRDGRNRDLEYAPTPEGPARFVKVLVQLARGCALANDRLIVTEHELSLIRRVAVDCLPPLRHDVVHALVEGPLTTEKVANAIPQASFSAVRRTLEDLRALDVVRLKRKLWKLHTDYALLLSN